MTTIIIDLIALVFMVIGAVLIHKSTPNISQQYGVDMTQAKEKQKEQTLGIILGICFISAAIATTMPTV